MSPLKTALSFVEAINPADIAMLAGLMTEDHTFISSDASEEYGYQRMRDGWP